MVNYIQVIQEESSIFFEVIMYVMVKKLVYMNMCPVLNGY